MEFKTKINRVVIPEKVIEEIVFACPECEDIFTKEAGVKTHYVMEHMNFAMPKTLNGDKLVKLNTEEEANLFSTYYIGYRYTLSWNGPGWYHYFKINDQLYIEPIETLLFELEEEIEKKQKSLELIRGLEK
jgi:hypothetical protein